MPSSNSVHRSLTSRLASPSGTSAEVQVVATRLLVERIGKPPFFRGFVPTVSVTHALTLSENIKGKVPE